MNARVPPEVTCKGFVIGNGDGSAYRTMEQGVCVWTPDREKALHFARRCDAELFCEEDEDACHIWPVALEVDPISDVTRLVADVVSYAGDLGLVVTVSQMSTAPFRMGGYSTISQVRERRPRAGE